MFFETAWASPLSGGVFLSALSKFLRARTAFHSRIQDPGRAWRFHGNPSHRWCRDRIWRQACGQCVHPQESRCCRRPRFPQVRHPLRWIPARPALPGSYGTAWGGPGWERLRPEGRSPRRVWGKSFSGGHSRDSRPRCSGRRLP